MKPLKSTDPRKPGVMEHLKRYSGGTKVTEVKEIIPNELFQGRCFKKGPGKSRIPLGTYRLIIGISYGYLATRVEKLEDE